MHTQNILDAAAILPLQPLYFGEPLFDLLQGITIKMNPLGVTTELRRSLLELRQRRFEQFDRRAQMLIHAGQFAKPSRVFTQTAYERGITLIQQIFAFTAALIKLFTVRQDIFCRAELFLFAGFESCSLELFDLCFQKRLLPTLLLE